MLKFNFLLKSTQVFLLFFGWILPASAQHNEMKALQSFGVSEGFERLYFDGAYHLKNLETGRINSFKEYRYVSNMENKHVVYKSKDGFYGILNKEFESVVAPEWIEIKDFGYGYFALAHYSGEMVVEDRGSGLKDYQVLTWKIFSINEDEFISDLELVNPICIYGEVLAETLSNRKVKIALGKINFGYTNPIMKALVYVNQSPAQSTISPASTSPRTKKP